MEKDKNENKLCEICGEIASSLCLQCINYLCDSCYKFIHDKQWNNHHKKEKIDNFIPIETKCLNHPKYPLGLFCVNEKGIYIYFLIFIYI